MKWILAAILALLCVVSLGVYASLPGNAAGVPILYWVSDPSAAKDEQVRLFGDWMRRNHPEAKVDLRLDASSTGIQKQVVQGVSGVAGDLIDAYNGGEVRYFRAVGLNSDITDAAEAGGFSVDKTYPAIRDDLTIPDEKGERRQYAFPCNVANQRFIVNLDALAAVDMPPPPGRWTVDEFERYGRQYARRLAEPGRFRDGRPRYLVDVVEHQQLARTYGIDLFNETLTGPGMDQVAYTADGPAAYMGFAEMLRRLYDWTYGPDHFMPSPSDLTALSSGAGFGGAQLAAFARGDFALQYGGRWYLIRYRQINKDRVAGGLPPLRLDSCETPYAIWPNVRVFERASMLYSGSPHKDLALHFFEFLASKEFNDNVIDNADGLPPVPAFTRSAAYLRPAEDAERGIYPQTEWKLHEAFLKDVETIGVADSFSPFVLYNVADKERQRVVDRVMSRDMAHDDAARAAAARIRQRVDESLARLPADDPLRQQFAAWSEDQTKIDAIKARGGKIPASLIHNGFHLKYYAAVGMLDAGH